MTSLLEVRDVSKSFVKGTGPRLVKIDAVDRVSISVDEGVNVGIIGESGSGKTTLGRLMTKLIDPEYGTVLYRGSDITHVKRRKSGAFSREVQMIFQDPYSSLDPRMPVSKSIADFMKVEGAPPNHDEILQYLEMVNLDSNVAGKRPGDLSGGQRQRVAVAKVLALHPRIIVADEPVSALDVSIRSQVLTMLEDLRRKAGITFAYITHDLSTLPFVADYVHVMYRGSIVESSGMDGIIQEPLHPYTKGLLAAVPDFGRSPTEVGKHIKSDADPDNVPPTGCKFYFRCAYAMPVCLNVVPRLLDQGGGRLVACHLYPADGGKGGPGNETT